MSLLSCLVLDVPSLMSRPLCPVPFCPVTIETMPRNKWSQLKREEVTSEWNCLSNIWLIQLLEIERQQWQKVDEIERQRSNETTPPLSQKQSGAFDAWCALLRESDVSLADRSRQRRSSRVRARALIISVFLKLGAEVFLLCALSTSISKLADNPKKEDLIHDLQIWWAAVLHPQGLTRTATAVCEANSIGTLTANYAGMDNLLVLHELGR